MSDLSKKFFSTPAGKAFVVQHGREMRNAIDAFEARIPKLKQQYDDAVASGNDDKVFTESLLLVIMMGFNDITTAINKFTEDLQRAEQTAAIEQRYQ